MINLQVPWKSVRCLKKEVIFLIIFFCHLLSPTSYYLISSLFYGNFSSLLFSSLPFPSLLFSSLPFPSLLYWVSLWSCWYLSFVAVKHFFILPLSSTITTLYAIKLFSLHNCMSFDTTPSLISLLNYHFLPGEALSSPSCIMLNAS